MTTLPPREPVFETLQELLGALGRVCGSAAEVESSIEEYADEYMDEDLGMNLVAHVGVGDEGEWVSLRAAMSFYTDDAVAMWILAAPFTISAFYRYLDELDLRVARLRAIVELPTGVDNSDGGGDQNSILSCLATLFDTNEAEVVRQLGDEWMPIESDEIGDSSTPVRYLLWNDRLIIGLDDESANFFVPMRAGGGARAGEVISNVDLGSSRTIGFSDFVRALQDALPTAD